MTFVSLTPIVAQLTVVASIYMYLSIYQISIYLCVNTQVILSTNTGVRGLWKTYLFHMSHYFQMPLQNPVTLEYTKEEE